MCQLTALKTNMLYLDGSSYLTIGLPTLGRENDPESMLILSSCSHGDSQQMCSSVWKILCRRILYILCRINVQATMCKSSQLLLTSLSAVIYIYRTAGSGLWCGFKLRIFSLILIKIKLEPWC